ncbi:MAG TPA: ATP-binding protein, partial [Arcobacter sp.]|nr:ATP-binding protein [Arcobacter sp.]
MNFNWTNIISLNNSQNDAFEELLCQLAKKEPIENKQEFIKVGNPDGGVECYVVLENGDELGFQAKWFSSTPQETQWSQVEHSFKTALEKHPKMITYYVATSLDRADPRVKNRTSFMEKWNEKVEKWQKLAKDRYSREIEFVYWGSSEFITRLSKEENAGLKSFFFGDIDLSTKWFKNQNKLAIKDLGARYTPEINVELEIVENFNALSRNNSFKEQIDELYHDMMVNFRKLLNRHHVNKNLIINLETLNNNLLDFESEYFELNLIGIEKINFEIIKSHLNNLESISENLFQFLEDLNEKEIKEKKIKTERGYRTSTSFDGYISDLRNANDSLYNFKYTLDKSFIKLANTPYMILKGEAGIGKSHLLADIINQRLEDGSDSIFLLGQHFMQEKSPWSQILDDLLRLKCNEDEFLGALNAKAEVNQKRTIIFIDAINEGKGRNFWSDYLVSFVESIKKYEWLGLVLSVRSSYFNLVIPIRIKNDESIATITHYGFDEIEYDASKIFFKYYNIEQPAIPLLHPEFSNPLFLKLFCERLQQKGLVRVPEGYEGISNIIKFFIEGIEDKLIRKYDPIKRLKLLNKIINSLIIQSLEKQVMLYDTAYQHVEEVSSKYGLNSGLLDDLISEGLLTQNLQYDYEIKEYHETVYFAYERFEDHLKVKYLFEQFLDRDNLKESFAKEPLCGYFENDMMYYNRGVIDAMNIQLPEICSVELIDMVDQNQVLLESFFEGLLWRKVDSISQYTADRIVKNIDNQYIQKNIFETFFLVASNAKHPLNANLMHNYLKDFSMKDRDVWFIPLLNEIYLDYGINPIKRLIDWSWSDEDKSYVSDESLLLTSIALSWFLITSNRQLRDYSTKALISILQGKITVLIELLKKFESIDELYIQERLFAVAFGVVVRTEHNKDLKELGEYIYKTIFDTEEVVPHILLRDYAKSTIEYISYLGIGLDIDLEKIKPPYKSYFPRIEELPTNEDLEKYEDRDDGYHQSTIISSMMTEYGNGRGYGGYGDFGRYVFGSKLYDFECKKDEQLISNYATTKIFEDYGYDGSFFNYAEKAIQENNRNRYDRREHKIERIGKKYQWIAMHDTLSRVTDNFKMRDPGSSGYDEEKQYIDYQGTYEPYVRDIDPTFLLKETKSSWYIETDSKLWW